MSKEARPELFSGWGYIPDKVKKAQKKVESSPYDVDAWSVLLREAANQPVEKARPLYEQLVATFPNSGRYWKAYTDQEFSMKPRKREEVIQLVRGLFEDWEVNED